MTKNAERDDLTAGEVLAAVFADLERKFGTKTVTFDGVRNEKPMAEIADDSDYHRSRTGYSAYDSARILEVGRRECCVALGQACGGYPADPYDRDIVCFDISTQGKTNKQITKEVHAALCQSSYFRNSLILSLANGKLASGHKVKGESVIKAIGPRISEFIAQEVKTDESLVSLVDLQPLVISPVLYRPEFVSFLSGVLEMAILS